MREVKPTQKPVPSSDIKNLFFNSGLLDIWATSLERKYIDRFGNCHLTAAGMEWLFKELVEKFKVDMNIAIVASGYIPVDSFQQGADLPNNELTQRNHILRDETTGEYFRWDGDLPKRVPADSTPQSTGGIGKGAWVSVGDASLRTDLGKLIKTVPDVSNMCRDTTLKNGDLVQTVSYHPVLHAVNSLYGGALYRISTLEDVREVTNDSMWEPDGYVDHYIDNGLVACLINKNNEVNVDCCGAKPNYPEFDNAKPFYYAAIAARKMAHGINLGKNNINSRPVVKYTAGVTYFQYSAVELNVEAVRLDFICDGVCTISGSNPSTPTIRTSLCNSFSRIYRTKFKGINFVGFNKIHEWDTNNADQCTVSYEECDFFDSGEVGIPVIDTRSYDKSRSTDLSFKNCRCSFVPMLLDSYCDTLRFEGGIYRSFDTEGCLIKADSLVTTIGGMFVPQYRGNNARWFDLYDNAQTGTRGFNSYGTRFSPEGGGIPVIYNYMQGLNTATNHLTNFIMFYGGSFLASSGTYEGGLVVLMDDGEQSFAPSMIGFYGASVRSNSGLVRTKTGKPVLREKGRFAIDVSHASQSHLSDINTPISVPLVESQLRKYLVCDDLYKVPTIFNSTGESEVINLDSIYAGYNPTIEVTGANSIISGIVGAYDFQNVTLLFINNGTVVEHSNGSNIYLNTRANFETGIYGSITLQFNRRRNIWIEVSRSKR
ncbi:MAG TPA: hypothetical protein DHV44_11195 [Providencia sp.]|nr:hypothetical protein [Providencia sp.]